MEFIRTNKRVIYVGIGLVIVAVIIWQIILAVTFRVTSISPKPTKQVASSTEDFRIRFNKNLDESVNYDQQATNNGSVVNSIRVSGSEILVSIRSLDSDRKYSFTLKDIRSEGGQVVPIIIIEFTTKYIPFNQLSDTEKEQQIEQTDVNAKEDPLDKFLPHSELGYYLTGMFVDDGNEQKYVLTARITLSKSDISVGKDMAIETQKLKIQEYIKSTGLNPATYTINYEVIDPPF